MIRDTWRRLVGLATLLLARLGLFLVPLASTGPVTPVVVPLFASSAAWLPLRPLGLPDEYTPMTGGEP